MQRSISDEASTASVVWAAAERIGKTANRDELERICDYLVKKNWFQTAGDLRAARQASGEWQSLEIPARLKIAIQQVLDENTRDYQPLSYFELQVGGASSAPLSTAPDDRHRVQEQWWDQAETAAVDANVNAQASPCTFAEVNDDSACALEAATCEYASDSYNERREEYPAEHYYYDPNNLGSSAYDGGEYAVVSEGAGASYYISDSSTTPGAMEQVEGGEAPVVEAETVDVEDGQIAPDVPVEWPAQPLATTWSCGQCTFANAISEAFCEMCMGHVSLSPDFALAAVGDEAIADEASSPAAELSAACSHGNPVAAAASVCALSDGKLSAGGVPLCEPPPAPVDASPIRTPWVVAMQSYAAGGIRFASPTSPAFAPSAPELDDESGEQVALEDAEPVVTPPYEGHQLCETSSSGTGSAKVDHVDFLALAFQRKATLDSVATETNDMEKAHRTRREETAEYV